MKLRAVCLLLFAAAFPLAAGGRADGSNGTVLVAAAASLRGVFEDELFPAFRARYPDIKVEGTFDASGKLQVQIENGLAADVFVPAAQTQMDALTRSGLIDAATVRPLLRNEVVLIKPAGAETAVTGFGNADLAAGVIALGDPRSVPAGQYAKEIFTRAGNWPAVERKANLGANVTAVLNWVAAGEAEAGVVYATDAAAINKAGKKVDVIAKASAALLPSPVTYPAGVAAASAHKKAAALFADFLFSAEAAAIFAAYGFTKW